METSTVMAWAPDFMIGSSRVGPGQRCYVIAEAGSNHDGDLDQALRLIEAARQAGADAIKFQLFAAYGLVARRIHSDDGQDVIPNPVYPLVERQQLPLEWLPRLSAEAQALGIELLMTPFGIERLVAWVELGARAIKIASADLNHVPLLRAAGASGLPVLLGCGMSTMEDVEGALETLAHAGAHAVALMHCVSRFPPQDDEINLRSMAALQGHFDVPVGFSDNGSGTTAILGAVAMGASVVEQHLTLDRSLPGPDHGQAAEPADFARMVREIRRLEQMLGDGQKRPSKAEQAELLSARRSIVAKCALKAGRTILREHVKCVRPGGGLPPARLEWVLGKTLKRDVAEDEMIQEDDLDRA